MKWMTGRVVDWLQSRVVDPLFRIRYRLLLVNLLIVSVPLLGISFANFYQREMLRSLEEDMIHQAQLLRQVLLAEAPPGPPPSAPVTATGCAAPRLGERRPTLVAAARDTRTRIRLLDANGHLCADSHAQGPPEGPEARPPSSPASYLLGRPSHLGQPRNEARAPQTLDVSQRPEVRSALAGKYGATSRVWKEHDVFYLFSALPVVRQGKVEGVIYVTRSTNPVRMAMYRLRSTLFRVLAGALAATAILSLFFAATISRPLSRLTAIAGRIAAGDRSQPLSLRRRDEIGQLARAFDAMTRKLDQRARYIGELAANISHEFKSPLTGIRGAAELLLEGAADDPAARARFLENILADAQRLDRLVNRLLELSRVESESAPEELLDYQALVREMAQRASGSAPVEVAYHARTMHLPGRRSHLAAAILNLLDNAQQHASPGTAICLRVSDRDGPESDGGWVRTSVHNHGRPISEANLARVWDRFFTTRSAQGGTGLGLAIVSAVVAAHGGSCSVLSSPEEGTTFSFDLPAATQAPPAAGRLGSGSRIS